MNDGQIFRWTLGMTRVVGEKPATSWDVPSGKLKLWKIIMCSGFRWIDPLKMEIFRSYVELPEDIGYTH